MASSEIEAIVLRAVRYGEADAVLTLYSRDRGRVSAIAKGARRPRSRLGACAQPGVRIEGTLHAGRGDLSRLGSASLLEPNAGIWARADRLQAAAAVLETAYRVLAEEDPSLEAYALLTRALGLLARAPVSCGPSHLHPIVLGFRAKLVVVSGLLPRLGHCTECAPGAELATFSARRGGVLCEDCAADGMPVPVDAVAGLADLIGRPLAEAFDVVPSAAAPAIDAMIVDVLSEGLGVQLTAPAAAGPSR